MNPGLVPAVIVAGTAASYVGAVAIGIPALVPFLNVAPAVPFMIASLRRGHVAEAVWLSRPVLGRMLRFEYRIAHQRRWIATAAGALRADIVLKWALAPSWREMIRNAAGW